MALPFTPFLPAVPVSSPSKSTPAGAFHEIHSPSQFPPADPSHSRPSHNLAPEDAQSQPLAHPHSPSIDVQREGDRITRVRIVCKCGEVIELDCDYSSAEEGRK